MPLREVESGTYSLYGRIPQGEQVLQSAGEWRVNELIGDFAQLQDVPRYGIVSDVIFDTQGSAQVVVVSRPNGSWGRAGWFAYPYHGFYPGTYAYALPFLGSKVSNAGAFSYAQLAKQSPYSNPRNARVIPDQQRR